MNRAFESPPTAEGSSDLPGSLLAQPDRPVSGICPIAIVPFQNDGQLDLQSFETVIGTVVSAGCRAMTLFGLASEYHKLEDSERSQLLRVFIRALAGSKVVPIASVTAHSWEVACWVARRYEDAGIGVINILPPFFLSPGIDAIIEHVERVCDAVSVPVMLQYAPAFTGIKIPPSNIAQIAAHHRNLLYAKVEAQPPTDYIDRLLQDSGGQVQALIGYQGLFYPQAAAAGCVGIQPGSAFPEVFVSMWRAWADGRRAEATAIYGQILPFVSYWMQQLELAIRVEKSILMRRGVIRSDYCRAPGWRLSRFDEQMIGQFLLLATELTGVRVTK